ncbi:MAG: DUF1700 domain-containing protein [Oscillospiraceae bacterium]
MDERNSKQYLWQLRSLLTGKVKHQELERLMTYYYDYFQERGPENEGAVMAELGTPEELAAKLLGQEVPHDAQPEPEPQQEQASYPPRSDYYQPNPHHGMPLWLKILLGFFLFPVIIAVVACVFAVVISVAAVAFGCVFGGIAVGIAGLSVILTSGPTTVLFAGAGLLCSGVGILVGIAAIALIKVSVLGTGHFFRWLFQGKAA